MTETTTPALGPVGTFLQHHYRHFNAAALLDAAKRLPGASWPVAAG